MSNENAIYIEKLNLKKSTAHARLDPIILFRLAQENSLDYCFRCLEKGNSKEEAKIKSTIDFQIDHIEDWDGRINAKELFFDINNISLSHPGCNSQSSRSRFAVSKKGIQLTKNKTKPYRARISINGKWKLIGDYSSEQEAKNAYDKAALNAYGPRAITHRMLSDDTIFNVALLKKFPNGQDRIYPQLGVSSSWARQLIRRMYIFHLAQFKNNGHLKCHRCDNEIVTLQEFSLEHIIDWRDTSDPFQTFFDIENISFSHRICNSRAAASKAGMKNKTGVIGVTDKGYGQKRYRVYVYDPQIKKRISKRSYSSLLAAALVYDYWVVKLQGQDAFTNVQAGITKKLLEA